MFIKQWLIVLVALIFANTAYTKEFKELKWVDLIPKADLDALLNPPRSIMNIPEGSSLDVIPTDPIASAMEDAVAESQKAMTPQEQSYYAALKSTNVNAGLNKQAIRLPGFIVPVEYNDDQVITEFFLVPYFGACIHVPPPPPNQIVYVKYPKGLTLEALYDPFWIEGELQTKIVENDMALSAYTVTAEAIKPYQVYQK